MDLQSFYPNDLKVEGIFQTDKVITIRMNAHSNSCSCPKCGMVFRHRHGTYERKIQDLLILGKSNLLLVNTYEYRCDNAD